MATPKHTTPEPLLAGKTRQNARNGWVERVATFMVGLCIGLMLLGIIYMGRANARRAAAESALQGQQGPAAQSPTAPAKAPAP